jgi:hypothetical protein
MDKGFFLLNVDSVHRSVEFYRVSFGIFVLANPVIKFIKIPGSSEHQAKHFWKPQSECGGGP